MGARRKSKIESLEKRLKDIPLDEINDRVSSLLSGSIDKSLIWPDSERSMHGFQELITILNQVSPHHPYAVAILTQASAILKIMASKPAMLLALPEDALSKRYVAFTSHFGDGSKSPANLTNYVALEIAADVHPEQLFENLYAASTNILVACKSSPEEINLTNLVVKAAIRAMTSYAEAHPKEAKDFAARLREFNTLPFEILEIYRRAKGPEFIEYFKTVIEDAQDGKLPNASNRRDRIFDIGLKARREFKKTGDDVYFDDQIEQIKDGPIKMQLLKAIEEDI